MVPVIAEPEFRFSSIVVNVSTLEDRPLRADARRNRAAILAAARAVFAKQGRDAQVDDVARRAKVGVGTLYRHFPTKEALLLALAEDKFRRLAGLAADSLKMEDPWDAIEDFLYRGADMHASDRSLGEALMFEPAMMREAALRTEGLVESIDALVQRAQAAGAMRADARWEDIPMVFCALSSIDGPPRASWQRMLALIVAGLRAPGTVALPD